MPHRGVSCHLFEDVVSSFFKNLLQKGGPTGGSAAVLALQYACRPRYVTSVILLTTVLSVLTLPVLLSWLM
jgi:predicted permease